MDLFFFSMVIPVKLVLLWFLCSVLYTAADETNSKEIVAAEQDVSTSYTYKTIALLTALTTVAGGIVVLAAWIIPLIAYKFCYLFGSCEYGLGVYVDQFLMGGRQNLLQRRSLDYLGPLLQNLASAYEMYEGSDSNDQKKNLKKGSFYRR